MLKILPTNTMKKLSMIMMGCSLLTLLSFQIPVNETETVDYMPIDTTLGGIDMDAELKTIDFDSENF